MTLSGFFKKFAKYLSYPFVVPYYGIMKAVNPLKYQHYDIFGNYNDIGFLKLLDSAITEQRTDDLAQLIEKGIFDYRSNIEAKDIIVHLFKNLSTFDNRSTTTAQGADPAAAYIALIERLFQFIDAEQGQAGYPHKDAMRALFDQNVLSIKDKTLQAKVAPLCGTISDKYKQYQASFNQDNIFFETMSDNINKAKTNKRLGELRHLIDVYFKNDPKYAELNSDIKKRSLTIDTALTSTTLTKLGNDIDNLSDEIQKKFKQDASKGCLKVKVLVKYLESSAQKLSGNQMNEYLDLISGKYAIRVLKYIKKNQQTPMLDLHKKMLIVILQKAIDRANVKVIKRVAAIDQNLLDHLLDGKTQLEKSKILRNSSPAVSYALVQEFNTSTDSLGGIAYEAYSYVIDGNPNKKFAKSLTPAEQKELMTFIKALWAKTGDFTYNDNKNVIMQLLSKLSHENVNKLLAEQMHNLTFNHSIPNMDDLQDLSVHIYRFQQNRKHEEDKARDTEKFFGIRAAGKALHDFQNKYFDQFIENMTAADLYRFDGINVMKDFKQTCKAFNLELQSTVEMGGVEMNLDAIKIFAQKYENDEKIKWIKSHKELAIEFLKDCESDFEKKHKDEKGVAIVMEYQAKAEAELKATGVTTHEVKSIGHYTKAFMLAHEKEMEDKYQTTLGQ